MKGLTQYIPYLISVGISLLSAGGVLIDNLTNTNPYLSYKTPENVVYGMIALGITGASIFLKRNIWSYLFLFSLIATYFPQIAFGSYSFAIIFGSLEIDLITTALLCAHILLNIEIFKPTPTTSEIEDDFTSKVAYFEGKYASKKREEIEAMDPAELVPEAQEARRRILDKNQ